MRKFNKREKILVGSFVVVLAIYLVSTYWITPIIEKIDELKNQQAELKTQWDEIRNWVGREKNLEQQVSAMETEVNQLVERIPPSNQSALYWDAFNRIARETGVVLTRMVEATAAGGAPKATGGPATGGKGTEGTETSGAGTEAGGTGTAPGGKTWSVTMSVNGPEAGIMQFLNRLQTMTYVVAVKTGTFDYHDGSILLTLELLLGSR
jgi:cell division protein FtsB